MARLKAESAPSVPLTPAWHYLLMTGDLAPGRVRGWVALFAQSLPAQPDRVDGWDHQRMGRQVWAQYGATLTAEARAHHFEAYWPEKIRPSGAAFEAWRDAFLRQHQY